MQKSVRILNPINDHHWANQNRARRYVKQGRAEWVRVGCSIRFISSDRRHREMKKTVDPTRVGYDIAAYEGMARLHEVSNLPMVLAGRALGLGQRKGATRHTFLAAQGF